ncbi:hypothetical protein GYB59_02265 [bacterium]|nr:hypothetical protein [bacterium]
MENFVSTGPSLVVSGWKSPRSKRRQVIQNGQASVELRLVYAGDFLKPCYRIDTPKRGGREYVEWSRIGCV